MRRRIASEIFVKIRGTGRKSKYRHENSYKFPEQWNRKYFLEFFCKGRQ